MVDWNNFAVSVYLVYLTEPGC